MFSPRWVLSLIACASLLGACGPHFLIGPTCGIAVVPDAHTDGGDVVFNDVPIGQSTLLQVPVKDTADAGETILGASIDGSDAFTVLSQFPIAIPAGTEAQLQIRFAPTEPGQASATLELQTEEMGESSVPLAGMGLAPDAG